MEAKSLALLGGAVLLGDAGGIAGQRGVDADADVGLDPVGGGLGENASERVRVGDMVVLDAPFMRMGDKVVSKALDNRVACWLGIEAIRGLGKTRTDAEIHVAFTVQEEVGLRGARTASFAIRPDIGIGIDTTLACDTPGVPEQDSTTVQGEGFGLHVRDSSFIASRGVSPRGCGGHACVR